MNIFHDTATLFCVLSFMSVPMLGRTYHVSKTGSDTERGTVEHPLLTISAAASRAVAGDSVIVHEGIYREWVSPVNAGINDQNRIVYMASPGDKVSIRGSEEVTGWKKVSGMVWKAEVPNEIFGDYNPFAVRIEGDWLIKGMENHLGAVYIDGLQLNECLDKSELSGKNLSWHATVDDCKTVILANFGTYDPRASLVEINVRKACFFPKVTGVNYITVKGFDISQAAPQWAPPTSGQEGMVGPNWSIGWIIEDCTLSYSKNVGISLGKDRATGHNQWTNLKKREGYYMHGHYREIEAILKAQEMGWDKSNIGSHLIQNNVIHDCGQAGIVGHMGAVFSVIRHNEIYAIGANSPHFGYEKAGIKLHAAIDVVIEDNCILNAPNGIWLDWQAQGTHVRRNVFSGNGQADLFVEVSHGPTMIYNNIFLSAIAIRTDSHGLAVFNNLISGGITVITSKDRHTPYHYPHSTHVKGFFNNMGGDVRFYNNVFLGNNSAGNQKSNGLSGYDDYPAWSDNVGDLETVDKHVGYKFPVWAECNVYYNLSRPYVNESGFSIDTSKVFYAILNKVGNGEYYLETDFAVSELYGYKTVEVTSEKLGYAMISEAVFENPDSTPFILDKDYYLIDRSLEYDAPGPFVKSLKGLCGLPVWKREYADE